MTETVDSAVSAANIELLNIDVARIRPFCGQPRQYFDPQKLLELAGSMEAIGQISPITVRRLFDDPEHDFEIADGERRWRAKQLAKHATIRAEVRAFKSVQEQFEFSMAANYAREDISPIESARGIDKMMQDPIYADLPVTRRYERVGKICGHSLTWASSTHSLLKLHPQVQAMLEPGAAQPIKISLGKELANNVMDQALQLKIAKIAQTKKLTMAKARLMFREVAIKAGKTHALRQPAPSDDRRAVERAIRGIGQDCERLLGMSGPSFRRAIMSASKGDQMDIVETIDKTTASLAELRDAVQNVITEKKTSRAEA